jgi:hypothetical protein
MPIRDSHVTSTSSLYRATAEGRDRADTAGWDSYGEFMTLFSKTVAERTRPGQRQDVEEQGNASPPWPYGYI